MNFTEHIVKEKLNIYGGSERKKTVILDDGKQYLLKFPDPIREHNRNLSYINNAISEYVGCHIFQSLGINAQNTILGTYTKEDGKTIIACACEDFATGNKELHEIKKLELGSLDSDVQRNITFETQNRLFEKIPCISAREVREFYYDLFIADSLIGNYNRHNGNWGVISDKDDIYLAPVYDCSSGLEPLLGDVELALENVYQYAINANSSLYDKNKKRIKYSDWFEKSNDRELIEAGKRIIPRINLDKINSIIDNTPYISEERKQFYKKLIEIRYKKILLPFLDRITSLSKQSKRE